MIYKQAFIKLMIQSHNRLLSQIFVQQQIFKITLRINEVPN